MCFFSKIPTLTFTDANWWTTGSVSSLNFRTRNGDMITSSPLSNSLRTKSSKPSLKVGVLGVFYFWCCSENTPSRSSTSPSKSRTVSWRCSLKTSLTWSSIYKNSPLLRSMNKVSSTHVEPSSHRLFPSNSLEGLVWKICCTTSNFSIIHRYLAIFHSSKKSRTAADWTTNLSSLFWRNNPRLAPISTSTTELTSPKTSKASSNGKLLWTLTIKIPMTSKNTPKAAK